MHFRSWRGLSNEYRAATDGHSAWRPGEKNPLPVCIHNISTADLDESLRAVVKKEGIGALAFIPLVSNGKLIGKFMAYFNTPHEFTPGEIDVGLTVARQLSFAIGRKRNDEALESSKLQLVNEAESLRKLNECSTRLWRMRNLKDGLEEMLDAIIALVGADKGNVQLLDPQRRVLTIEAQRGFEKDFLEFFREVSADEDCACGRALRTRERIIVENVEKDPLFAPFREMAQAAGYRAVTSTPLVGKDNALLGVLSTHFCLPHRPSNSELAKMDLYARQAADFIERCSREEELRVGEERYRTLTHELDKEVRSRTIELQKRNAELLSKSREARELSRHLMDAQDQERRKVARNLHDSAGQTLALLSMTLHKLVEACQNYPEAMNLAKQTEESVRQLDREIRTASYLLHPPLLDESGLASAIRMYLEGLHARSELEITLRVSDDFQRLPPELELVLFRLVQECLTNVHKHSGSKRASIRLANEQDSVVVEIRDDGDGISPQKLAEIQSAGSGLGIRGMRERVQQFHGTLSLESDDSGTRVLAAIPLPKAVFSNGIESWEAAV
jgi:signal transduction histidine kinase